MNRIAFAAALLALAGISRAENQIQIDFNGTLYTFDRPKIARSHAPAGSAAARNNQQNMALRKIKLNPKAGTDDLLVGKLQPGLDLYAVVRELYQAGFKVQALNDGQGVYFLAVDVSGDDAADRAIGLAKYYYVAEVLVGKKVFEAIFPPSNP